MTPERWQQVKGVLQDVLELDEARRAAFLEQVCQGDATLRLEVESLLAEERASSDGFLHPLQLSAAVFAAGPEDSWVGSRLGPYQVVAKIGEGGMGAVYRAVRADEQYEKQVAIKIVRHGLDSAFALARFRAERQILANLDHPNIARLLDGGTTDTGLPYLVMELVEGVPIDQYCNSHKLSIQQRLHLFLRVCSAVQYAHQRLVIHRDLKPGNILVTADGTPKLLDFGIAKILDPGSAPEGVEPTISMLCMLTPEYASPEQIRSETVTTASDVYSLGVVLFLLLTGQRPYKLQSHSPEAVLRAVCETEPAKPSTVVRWAKADQSSGSARTTALIQAGDDSAEKLSKRLRGDLDNIVLMALRKDPQRRFPSADHFAEDIRRYLHDLPVTARTDSFRYRASKFIVRHKRAMIAAGLVVVMVLGLMAAIARQAQIARVQRERAERRFQDVRELANSLIFDVHDSIQDLAGATAARKLIVSKALQYLDSLGQEAHGDQSLQRELAEAYKRIGDVQGNEFSANLGDTTNALKSYQKALAIREELWPAKKGDIGEALSLAELYRLVSQTQQFAGQLSFALETARKGVELMESMGKSHPDDPKVVFELLADYQTVANILGGDLGLSNLGDNDAAMVYRQKQLDAAEHFAKLDGGMKGRGNLAIAISTMGDQLWQGGEIDQSLQHYIRAKPLFEEIAFRSSKSARGRYLLGLLYERITVVHLAKGSLDQAYATANEALKLSKGLNAADPRDVQSGITLVLDQKLIADVESRRGHTAIATSELQKSMALLPHLVALSPQDTEVLGTEADVYTTAGDLARRSGDFQQALEHYVDAIGVLAKLPSENGANPGAARRLAAIYNNVGRVQGRLHSVDAAEEAYRKALGLVEAAATLGHSNMQAVYGTADAYAGLGEVESIRASASRLTRAERMEHWQRAVFWYSQGAEMWKRVKQAGLVSPDGFESVPPNVVASRLSQAQASLRLLSAQSD